MRLETKNLKLIEAASRELQHVGLDDALRVATYRLSSAVSRLNNRSISQKTPLLRGLGAVPEEGLEPPTRGS